jgi:hypothetical protein
MGGLLATVVPKHTNDLGTSTVTDMCNNQTWLKGLLSSVIYSFVWSSRGLWVDRKEVKGQA